jgi:hypothetical protein
MYGKDDAAGLWIDEKPVREVVSDEERGAFFQCARLILNRFELVDADTRPVSYGDRLTIGIKVSSGSISAHFDDYAGLPAEWRASVERVIELSRGKSARTAPAGSPK